MDNSDRNIGIIDLGKYIETLIRQWRLIIGFTLLCAFMTVLVRVVVVPKTYETRALVSSTRQISFASFGSQIETLTEEEFENKNTQGNYITRLNSYVEIVESPIIASRVISKMRERIPANLQKEEALLRKVEGELVPNSEVIAIKVAYGDPVLASEIANTWAQYYVEHVNNIYAGSGNELVASAVRSQIESYYSKYEQAQYDLEKFLIDYQGDELKRQIHELQTILDNTKESQTELLNSTISKMIEHDLNVVDNYFYTVTQNQIYILSEYNHRYDQLGRLTNLLDAAQNMRDQIQAGGVNAAQSNTLALMILKLEAFSVNNSDSLLEERVNESPNIEVQTNLESGTPEQMISDIDSLISVLISYKATLEEEIITLSKELALENGGRTEIEELTEQMRQDGALGASEEILKFSGVESLLSLENMDSPLQEKIVDLEQQIRDFKSELEDIQAKERELIHDRNLYWNTYKDLKTKAAELDVSANTANRAVTLSANAPVPTHETANSIINIVLTTVSSFILIVGVIFIIEFWWSYKGIEPKPITLKMILSSQEE